MSDDQFKAGALDEITLALPDDEVSGPVSRYQPGEIVGRYRILEILGGGGMGEVYEAYDPELGRRVALKLLATRRRTSPYAQRRLVREARALAKLSHPHVVQVYDVGLHGEDVFAAMEYVEGQCLQEWTRRKPRPGWREVLRVFLDAARGLAAAHEKGLIHRDVKPSNMLIGKDGRVRVADFGLAAALQRDVPSSEEHSDDADSDTWLSDSVPVGHPDAPTKNAKLGSRQEERPGRPVDRPATRSDSESKSHDSTSGRSLSSDSESPVWSGLVGWLEERMTVTGAIIGTPAFMAPEQHTQTELDPSADQYGFCASLYAGLYGKLPFATPGERGEKKLSGMARLLVRKLNGDVTPPPPGTEVPDWVYRVLLRGLAGKPEQRFPSMQALIAALEDDPAVRWRKRMRIAAAIAAICVVIALFGSIRLERSGAACDDAASELAGVWDDGVKKRVSAAFSATKSIYAGELYYRFSAILDRYTGAWVAMKSDACEATHVHKRQSEATLALREHCLERRRSQMRALVALFARDVDSARLHKSVQAATELPDIEYCGDTTALTAAVPLPEDPEMRMRVKRFHERVDEIVALREAGRPREGLPIGEALLREVGNWDYAPIRARTMWEVALLRERSGQYASAEELMRQLLPVAAQAKDDALAARAWSSLIFLVGGRQGRQNDVAPLFLPATTAVQRAGDDLARAHLANSLGVVLRMQEKYEEALLHNRSALALRQRVLGADHHKVGPTHHNLASTFRDMGRYAEAKHSYQRAAEIFAKALGPDHPMVAYPLAGLGTTLMYLNKPQEGLAALTRALTIRRNALGPDHPEVAQSLLALGQAYEQQHKPTEALQFFRAAYEISEARPASDRGDILYGLARALWALGQDRMGALGLAEQARQFYVSKSKEPCANKVAQWLDERRAELSSPAQRERQEQVGQLRPERTE